MNIPQKFNSNAWLAITTIAVCIFVGANQESASNQASASKQADELAQKKVTKVADSIRLGELEKRVEILERVLFSSAKLELNRAERRLARGQEELRNTRALFTRGLVNAAKLAQDQEVVSQAERELGFAKSQTNQKVLASELDVQQAEQDLEFAQQELTYRRNMANRGYISQAEVKGYATRVDNATQKLKFAKTKLEAAEQLKGMKK